MMVFCSRISQIDANHFSDVKAATHINSPVAKDCFSTSEPTTVTGKGMFNAERIQIDHRQTIHQPDHQMDKFTSHRSVNSIGLASNNEIKLIHLFCHLQNCFGLRDGTTFANHQNGCKTFYTCHHGQYAESRCEDHLLFNERIRGCDWPQNVQCLCGALCYGNSKPSPPQRPPPPPKQPPPPGALPPIIENHPSDPNCNAALQVPKCPRQPCPPENCVAQACIPQDKFYQNY